MDQSVKPKLCIQCKHLLPTNRDVFGRCSLFPRESIVANYLVTGMDDKSNADHYFYCSTARTNEDMCGKEGIKFQIKYPKKKSTFYSEEKGDL
jgi:hypothetical protein